MACVYKRKNPGGEDVWRVVFRRKDIPTVSFTFLDENEARTFVKNNEPNFLIDPERFIADKEKIKLSGRRDRDMKRILKAP